MRFHYVDIRLYIGSLIYSLSEKLLKLSKKGLYNSNMSGDDLKEYEKKLKILLIDINDTYKYINTKNELKIQDDDNNHIKNKKKIFNKILFNYTHDNIKNKLEEFYWMINYKYKKIIRYMDKINKLLNEIKKNKNNNENIYKKIYKNQRKIFDKYALLNVYIMDLYFLRRFLDKDYITNCVSYTGAHHSLNYIYILIKYFDFKITNYSYLKKNIEKTINKINKSNMKKINNLEYLFVKNDEIQCSNMKGFPKNFK
jgi:hypothetical protein